MSDRISQRALRIVAAVVLVCGAPLVLLLTPVLFAVSGAIDLMRPGKSAGFSRLLAMVLNYLILEWIGVLAACGLWVATGFGLFMGTGLSRRVHYMVQAWWGQSVFAAAQKWLRLQVDFEGSTLAGGAPLIVAAQHASFFDALLPTLLLSQGGRHPVRHVLKRQLAWDPCLGIYGHRHANHFVNRRSGDSVELEAIEALAKGAGNEPLVIFPEGTFRSATNPELISEKVAASDPERGDRLQLSHTLPPRPGGILALLRGAPEADVVFVGHVGFEAFGSLCSIASSVPFSEPVKVKSWRVPAERFGADPVANLRVIDRYWQLMDDWISEQAESATGPCSASYVRGRFARTLPNRVRDRLRVGTGPS